MEYIVQDRKPSSFFRYFEEISAIPRASYNESGIADYLVAFAKSRGLEYYRDRLNNVLIKAPATAGQEEKNPLLFQGHTDMVCEKKRNVEHDFLRDPLKLRVDGNLLRADGTSLGADNGVAVAIMLALLDGEIKEHPTYECLFTATEEPGLVGALNFDYGRISSRTMINLDAGNMNIALCCCAGGMCSDLVLPCRMDSFAGEALRVRIDGLVGGHAGCDIHRGRANANKVMGRLLAELLPTIDARVITLKGGLKEGAIARECEMLLSVPDIKAASDILHASAEAISRELVTEDHAFCVEIEPIEPCAKMMSREDTARVCAVLDCTVNGVLAMNRRMTYLVEYSRNLGVIYTKNDCVTFVFYTHALREGQLDATERELEAFARVVGATVKHYNRYPGWEFAPTSSLRDAYLRAFRETVGREALAVGVHAGLECGIVCSKIPNMDAISLGPNTYSIHSPDEALDLESCETFWKILARLIEIL